MNKNKPQIVPNELSKEQKHTMKDRVLTALVMAAIAVPSLFFGGWIWFAVELFLILIASFEIMNVPGKKVPVTVYVCTGITILYLTFWAFFKNNLDAYFSPMKDNYVAYLEKSFLFDGLLSFNFKSIYVSSTGMIICIIILFFVALLKTEFTVHDACFFVAMALLLGMGFQSVYYLRYFPFLSFYDTISSTSSSAEALAKINRWDFRFLQSAFLIIYVCLAVCFNDMGAYFTGVLFGKNKVNPRISPKKTWEGVLGGAIVGILISTAFGLIVSLLGMPILPFFSHNEWYWIVFASCILVFVANIGDFAFSAIKRFFNVKDYGHIFRAHGGVLDRIDSILFSSIVIAVFLSLLSQGFQIFGL